MVWNTGHFAEKTFRTSLFEQVLNCSSYSVIVRVSVVLKRTVVGDWRFDNLCGSHLQSQGFKPFTLLSFELFAKFLIVILHNYYNLHNNYNIIIYINIKVILIDTDDIFYLHMSLWIRSNGENVITSNFQLHRGVCDHDQYSYLKKGKNHPLYENVRTPHSND